MARKIVLSTVAKALLKILPALAALFLPAFAADPTGAEMQLRVGVLPVRDEAEQPKLAGKLEKMLPPRLSARFDEVEFIALDPDLLAGDPAAPVLLETAVKLGAAAEVDLLLDCSFGGVKIAGGNWPSLTSSNPEALGRLRWRLVNCSDGLLVADGKIDPDRYKPYSQRIRSEDELSRRVLQDLVLELGDALEHAKLEELGGPDVPPTAEEAGDPLRLTPEQPDDADESEPAGSTGDAQ